MTYSNQMLHGYQLGKRKIFTATTTIPRTGQNFVTNADAWSVCGMVANLLVFFLPKCSFKIPAALSTGIGIICIFLPLSPLILKTVLNIRITAVHITIWMSEYPIEPLNHVSLMTLTDLERWARDTQF